MMQAHRLRDFVPRRRLDAMHLNDMLCQINPNCRNLS